jgi:hypothetical protein
MKKILIGAALAVSIFVSSVAFAYDGEEPRTIQTSSVSIMSIEGYQPKPVEVINSGFIWGFPEGLVNDNSETGHCDSWTFMALSVGWTYNEFEKLSYVIHRESRCNPLSFNETDPNGGSRGLMQINGFWCRPWKYSEKGWLQDRGIINSCEDLFDPVLNLRAGLAIFMYGEENYGCGWKNAWATRCSKK